MIKHLSKLLSGSALGQLVAFLIIPILTHVYPPEVFGEYQLVFSVSLFIGVLLSCKIEVALPTIDGSELSGTIRAIVKLVFINTLILAAFILLASQFSHLYTGEFDLVEILSYSLLIGVLIALTNTARFYLIEKDKFGTISLTLMLQSGGRSVLQWALHLVSSAGLVLGDVLARLLMLAVTWRSAEKTNTPVSVVPLPALLTKFWRYPVWVVPSTLMNNSMALLLIPLITYRYGIVEAGVAAVAYRLITAPNSLIGAAFSDVLFARFSKMHKAGNNRALIKDFALFSGLMMLLSAVGFSLIYWLAPHLVLLVDDAYSEAAVILVALIPWFAAQFAVTPVSRVVFIFDKQLVKLIFDLLVLANLLWQLLLRPESDLISFLTSTSVSMAVIYGIYWCLLALIVMSQARIKRVTHV